MTSATHVRRARSPEQLPAPAPKCAPRLLCRRPFRQRLSEARSVHLALEPGRQRRRCLRTERGALPHLLERLGKAAVATSIPAHPRAEEVLEDLHVPVVAEAGGDFRHSGAVIARHPLDDGVEVRLDELQRRLADLAGVRRSPDELDRLAGIELVAHGDLETATDTGGVAEVAHRAENPLALHPVLLALRRAVERFVERG